MCSGLSLCYQLRNTKLVTYDEPISDVVDNFGLRGKPTDLIFSSISFPFLACLLSRLFVVACPFHHTFLDM